MLNMKVIEVWKPIKGYEGIYEISNFGRIKSLDRFVEHKRSGLIHIKEKILKPHISSKGYYCQWLHKDGIKKSIFIHRLVAEAFISNPYNFPYVNHKDENPKNNYVGNLEWCTHKYNMNYGSINIKKSNTWKKRIADSRFVQYTKDGRFVREWFNVDLASKKTMIPKEAILKCLNYERKFASGFIFKYEKISNL